MLEIGFMFFRKRKVLLYGYSIMIRLKNHLNKFRLFFDTGSAFSVSLPCRPAAIIRPASENGLLFLIVFDSICFNNCRCKNSYFLRRHFR